VPRKFRQVLARGPHGRVPAAESNDLWQIVPARKPFNPLTAQAFKPRLDVLDRGVTMPMNRAMLRQALSELVRLKGGAENSTHFLAELYHSALTEWAEVLGVDRHKLDKLVHIREAISDRRLH
jgi:hypothetical protein